MVKSRQEVLQTQHHWLLIGWKLSSDFNHHGDKEIIYCMSLGLQTLCCIDLSTFSIICLNISIWFLSRNFGSNFDIFHLIVEFRFLCSLCVPPYSGLLHLWGSLCVFSCSNYLLCLHFNVVVEVHCMYCDMLA